MSNKISLSILGLAVAAITVPLSAESLSFDQLNFPALEQAATEAPPVEARTTASESLYGGQILAFRTGEGRYSKLQVLGTGDALTARWETLESDGSVRSQGDLVVPIDRWIDLDTGTVLAESRPEADLHYDGKALVAGSGSKTVTALQIPRGLSSSSAPLLPPPGSTVGSDDGRESTGQFGTTLSAVTLPQNLFSTTGDADGDGLRDSMENALAHRLRPFFRFDSAEAHRQPFEPVTVFQVRPNDLCSPGELKVVIRWVFLFENDGGYGPNGGWFCGDSHPGDNDIATFYLTSTNGGTTWSVTSIILGPGGLHWPLDISTLVVFQDTHPVIFMSSHKHHEHFDTSLDHKISPYTAWWCKDDVNGAGASFLSNVNSVGPSATFNNVGESSAHAFPFIDSFDEFYPGHSAWGTNNFFDVTPTRNKWLTHDFAPLDSCSCVSGSIRTVFCTDPAGTRTDFCVRGIWDLGVCTGGGGTHPN